MSSTVPLFEGPKAEFNDLLDEGYEFTGAAAFFDSAASAHGTDSWVFQVAGDGVTASPSLRTPLLPVKEGDALEVSGWMRRATTATVSKGDLRLLTFDSAGASETVVMTKTPAGATAVWIDVGTSTYIVPAGVAFVRLECRINLATPSAAEQFEWDDVAIRSPKSLTVIASGILSSGVIAADGFGSTAVTLTALGNGWTYTPGAIFFIRDVGSGNTALQSGSVWMGAPQKFYAAATSGGALTATLAASPQVALATVGLTAGTPQIGLVVRNAHVANTLEIECHYYVMVEEGAD